MRSQSSAAVSGRASICVRVAAFGSSLVDRTEVLVVPRFEFRPRVRVTLAAEMLERVGGRDTPDAGRTIERDAHRNTLHQAAAKRVADTRGIDDAVRMDRRNVRPTLACDYRRAVLAASDD